MMMDLRSMGLGDANPYQKYHASQKLFACKLEKVSLVVAYRKEVDIKVVLKDLASMIYSSCELGLHWARCDESRGQSELLSLFLPVFDRANVTKVRLEPKNELVFTRQQMLTICASLRKEQKSGHWMDTVNKDNNSQCQLFVDCKPEVKVQVLALNKIQATLQK